MANLVAFVDAGFLKAEGARTLGVPPGQTKLIAQGVVEVMHAFAADEGCRLLRTYWYDGAFETKTQNYIRQRPYFDAISLTPGIQLRLGHVKMSTPSWHAAVKGAITNCGWDIAQFTQHFTFLPQFEQKGVDTLIVLDLVRLAQRRAYDTAVLLAGDRDLAEAVRVAQDEGRRLVLTYPSAGGVAGELRQLADEVRPLTQDELDQMVKVTP